MNAYGESIEMFGMMAACVVTYCTLVFAIKPWRLQQKYELHTAGRLLRAMSFIVAKCLYASDSDGRLSVGCVLCFMAMNS